MPKVKTRKSAAARYKVTKSGKIKAKSQGTRHILTKKSAKRKRRLRAPSLLSPTEFPRARKLLPYG